MRRLSTVACEVCPTRLATCQALRLGLAFGLFFVFALAAVFVFAVFLAGVLAFAADISHFVFSGCRGTLDTAGSVTNAMCRERTLPSLPRVERSACNSRCLGVRVDRAFPLSRGGVDLVALGA